MYQMIRFTEMEQSPLSHVWLMNTPFRSLLYYHKELKSISFSRVIIIIQVILDI